jgi:mono/diheme cytochrome c family protein
MTFLLAALLAVGAAAAADAPAQAGRALFNESGCRSCHSVGNLGGNSGPDLTFVGFRRSEKWLDLWLRDPHGWKPDTQMPDFKLTDASRQALVAWLAQLKGQDFSAHKPWDGAAQPGQVVFARAGCVGCHGAQGRGGHPNNNVQGGVIPALPALVATYTKDELISKIKRGVTPEKADPKGAEPLVKMPAWGEVLSDEEIGAVADYLLTLAPKDKKAEW